MRWHRWSLGSRWVAIVVLAAVGVTGLAAGAAAQDQQPVTVQLAAEGDSGVTGTAVLTADGDKTKVAVDLQGGEAGYEGHLLDSTCDNHQAATVFYPLEAVDANGHSDTVVDASLGELTNGKYWVHIHRPAAGRGVGVACGQIPSSVDLPATGVGIAGDRVPVAWFLAGLLVAAAALGAAFALRRRGLAVP
jgi:hypothetical protein